jgi:hypothetical protein
MVGAISVRESDEAVVGEEGTKDPGVGEAVMSQWRMDPSDPPVTRIG